MKNILLTQNKVALIDNDMFETINQHNWFAKRSKTTYYAVRNGRSNNKRKQIQMHHAVWELAHPEFIGTNYHIDHRDGDGCNNKISNLRMAEQINNNKNARKARNCSSQYKGVHFNKEFGKYRASICAGSKLSNGSHAHIHLGYFDDEIEAAKAYDRAALEYFGSFAKLNFPKYKGFDKF